MRPIGRHVGRHEGHKGQRRRRGQVAMESLMVYGWAILGVLIVIAALAYFGVLNPQQFLPTKCQLPVGLTCTAYALSKQPQNSMLELANGIGADIMVMDIRIGSETGLLQCTAQNLSVILTAGNTYQHRFGQCTEDANNCCSIGPKAYTGLRVKGPIGITYLNFRNNIVYLVNGTIITDLEE